MPDSPPDPSPPPLVPDPGIFRNRDFALYWVSRLALTLGVMTEAVTLGWQVYAVARLDHSVRESAFYVGMVGLAQFLPYFALTLFAGQIADRIERKRIILICLSVQVVLDIALTVLALNPHAPLTAIFVVAAAFGVVRAFASPAFSAMTPMLVERRQLPKAIAWSSLSWQTGAVMGPVIAGALVAIHPAVAYGTAGVLYAVAAITVSLIRKDTTPAPTSAKALAMIREGLVYVWTNRIVFGAMSLDLAAVLLGGATALLPVFARDVLHVGASGFGLLRAVPPSARPSSPPSSPSAPSSGARGCGCWAGWRCSGWPPWGSPCRGICGCRWCFWPFSAQATPSASSCARASFRS